MGGVQWGEGGGGGGVTAINRGGEKDEIAAG